MMTFQLPVSCVASGDVLWESRCHYSA